jgi:hypothetical protein
MSYFPPSNYPREPGSGEPGDSWGRQITVTGKLKGIDFGQQFAEVLTPLLLPPLPAFGKDTKEERDLISYLRGHIAHLRNRLYSAETIGPGSLFSPADQDALRLLIDRASRDLDGIPDVYAKWMRFPCMLGSATPYCPWPLSEGDNLGDWKARCGEAIGTGLYDPGRTHEEDGVRFQCPAPMNPSEYSSHLRPVARQDIANRIVGAMHCIRSTQFLMMRIRLHRQAVRLFREKHMFAPDLMDEPRDPIPTSPFSKGSLWTGADEPDVDWNPLDPREPVGAGAIPGQTFDPDSIPTEPVGPGGIPGQTLDPDAFEPFDDAPWPPLPDADAAPPAPTSEKKDNTAAYMWGAGILGGLLFLVTRKRK